MAVDAKEEPKLPAGIYPTKVDLGDGDVPAVPPPENPPEIPLRPEVSRSQWEPTFERWRRRERQKRREKSG